MQERVRGKKGKRRNRKIREKKIKNKNPYSVCLARMIQSPASPGTGAASAKASALASRASILMSAIGGKFARIEAGAAAAAGAGAGTGAGAGAGEDTGAADVRPKKEVMMVVTIIVMAEVKV